MVNYCIDLHTCKRELIAQHFNDDLWDKSGSCNGMCDNCSSKQKNNVGVAATSSSSSSGMNCINEVKLICEVIERNEEKGKKEKRVTANKLVELVCAELNSKKNKSAGYNHLSKLEVESLILCMLMKKYLKEDFHFTPYNTICYVVNGPKSGRLDYESEFVMMFDRAGAKSSSASVSTKKESKEWTNHKSKVGNNKSTASLKYEVIDESTNEEEVNVDDENAYDDDDDCQLIFDQDDEKLTRKTRRLSVEEEEEENVWSNGSKKSKIEIE